GVGAQWWHIRSLTIGSIAHAQADDIQTVEHIQFGDTQAGQAVVEGRAPQAYAIEPATAPRTARGRAVFGAAIGQVPAVGVGQFGWKWARTDAGGIRLDDPQNVVEVSRPDA